MSKTKLAFTIACAILFGHLSSLTADCGCHISSSSSSSSSSDSSNSSSPAENFKTKTPIKYLVVIFPENRSFDHLFGAYPHALNLPGEPHFKAKKNTPSINGFTKAVLQHNTNLFAPFRLDRDHVVTPEPAHHYTELQQMAHAGLLDQFCQVNHNDRLPMAYFDGNTVTALWNYAQRFSMSDNCCSTTMTPSSPGHINLVSGLTHGVVPPHLVSGSGEVLVDAGTMLNDPDPEFDKCSVIETVRMENANVNVGNLLNNKSITWGWFQGGFRSCTKAHVNRNGDLVIDYIPHHEPFQYYASTSNPQHLPPSSVSKIGFQDQANHQYDIEDFWAAIKINQMPAVSFLKPAAYQDGHPKYSDQLALQTFLVKTINRLQKLPEWEQMAIIIMWDDSGGWYDHVMPTIINQSHIPEDALLGPGDAGNPPPGAYQGRLAYGMRIPFLLISPFAKSNYVDHSMIDQTSVLRFIERNWGLGLIGDQSFDRVAGSLNPMFDFAHPDPSILLLDPDTGLVRKSKGGVKNQF